MRKGDYKYIWSSRGKHELYDLAKDPEELRDLDESQPDVAERLKERLLAGERPAAGGSRARRGPAG